MNRTNILDEIERYLDEHLVEKEFVPGISEVPVSGSHITIADKLSLIDTVLDGWYTEHSVSIQLAKELAKYIGVGYCSLCNSGSSADTLAINAVKHLFKGGYKVITTAVCFPTIITPIVQNFYQPIFIDTDPLTLQPDLNKLEELLDSDDVAGVILTHILGFPFDAARVQKICEKSNKFYIEDNCDSYSSEVNGKRTGSFGTFSTLSMFPAHLFTSGEGGAIFANSSKAIKLVEQYKNWGRDCYCLPGQQNICGNRFEYIWNKLPAGYDHKYTFTRLGYNMKITDLQAALGLSQFHRIDETVKARRNNYNYLYFMLLYRYPEYIEFIHIMDWATPTPFGFPIFIKKDAPFNRNDLTRYLEEHKVRTRTVFSGNITRQPMMEQVYYEIAQPLVGSDAIMERMLWVGCHPELTKNHLDYISEVIEGFFKDKGLK